MARTEKEKNSSGVLQKSKNQKETRAWKNKWISKVKRGFLFNFQTGQAQKKSGQPDSIMFGLVGQLDRAKICPVFSGQQNRVQPGPNFGLDGLAQRAGLKLLALHIMHFDEYYF